MAKRKQSKRDTVTYDLRNSKGEIVYRGTTNDSDRRKQEHRDEGKQFANLTVTSQKMTEDGAMRKESKDLATYRRGHGGSNPKYNKDDDG